MSGELKIGESVYIDDPAKVWHGCIGKVIGIEVGKMPFKVQFLVECRDGVWKTASAWFDPDRLKVQGHVFNKWTAVLCDRAEGEACQPPQLVCEGAREDDDEDILDTAARITRGDRSASYGPPDQDFRRTAGMWSALFAAKLKDGVTFEPRDVALAMILLKASRETHQRKRDNWVDIAGYARCGSLCQ